MTTKRLILGLFLLSAVSPQAAQAGDRFGLIDTTVILFCDKAAEVEISGRRTTTTGPVRRYHVRLEPGRHSIVGGGRGWQKLPISSRLAACWNPRLCMRL